jgi:DamX protein
LVVGLWSRRRGVKIVAVAAHTHDDGFREIQLNGKQLVFLFMTVTVVSVLIFLLGVLVGRGVRAERAAAVDAAAITEPAPPDPATTPAPATAAAADPTTAAPPAKQDEDLSYFDRLEQSKPQVEELKPSAPVAKAAPAERPAPIPATVPPAAKDRPSVAAKSVPAEKPEEKPAATATSGAAPGPGYAVQVAALNVLSEADAIAKRLAAKGYQAYVQTPANGPSVFRVRVGTFKTRQEAETMAAKLQKEEQFKPWVTR